MNKNNPFLSSIFAQTSWRRLLYVLILLAILWLGVIWAVNLP